MFSKVLKQRQRNEYPHGLSVETINEVSAYCAEHFGCPLPEGYVNFLMEANGFSYDGRSVFCCYNDDIQKHYPRYASLDFVTFNTKFYGNTDISAYLMLGKSSIDYVCYEKATKKYLVLTNGTMQLISESNDFESLLELFFGI